MGFFLDNVLFSFSVGFSVLNEGKEKIHEVTLSEKNNISVPRVVCFTNKVDVKSWKTVIQKT